MTTSTSTLSAKALSFKEVFDTAATSYAATKNEALQRVEVAETEEDKMLNAATAKRADTHERYTNALSSMSDKALSILSKYKVDAEALASQSRELKKRSVAILEALANNQKVNDRALDAVLQYIVSKNAASMTLLQVQHEMQHETTTQAQYFKTCAIFFKFATYSKSEKKIDLNSDAAVLRDLLKIYAV
jgi:hypothetical protein